MPRVDQVSYICCPDINPLVSPTYTLHQPAASSSEEAAKQASVWEIIVTITCLEPRRVLSSTTEQAQSRTKANEASPLLPHPLPFSLVPLPFSSLSISPSHLSSPSLLNLLTKRHQQKAAEKAYDLLVGSYVADVFFPAPAPAAAPDWYRWNQRHRLSVRHETLEMTGACFFDVFVARGDEFKIEVKEVKR
jgi:hypothetical protein